MNELPPPPRALQLVRAACTAADPQTRADVLALIDSTAAGELLTFYEAAAAGDLARRLVIVEQLEHPWSEIAAAVDGSEG